MNNSLLSNTGTRARQRGAAAVEFALAAIPFFLLLFGVIEFGRLLYLWNTAQEVTRRAARMAVVTDFNNSAQIAAIKRNAVFRLVTDTEDWLPATYHADITKRLSDQNIVIRYLNASGGTPTPMPANPGDNITACLDSGRVNSCIRYVEVCISTKSNSCAADDRLSFVPMLGLFSRNDASNYNINMSLLKIPLATVRVPAESLGFSNTF
ncbi:MAG: hypothetical protein H6R01_1170 [Burkholderiaceae bacterium]|nr:hypothetical protein [Burkholderiaceae bacterium]